MAECRARTTAARMLCLSLRIRILLFPPPESRAVAYRDALSFTFVFRFSPCPRTWMSITCLFIDGEHHFLSLSLIHCHCLRERNRERERERVHRHRHCHWHEKSHRAQCSAVRCRRRRCPVALMRRRTKRTKTTKTKGKIRVCVWRSKYTL